MTFDISGVNPRSKKGDYFGTNNWWWRRLWDFVCLTSDDVLTAEDKEMGGFNDCHKYSKAKANSIAKNLKEALKHKEKYSGWLKDNEKSYIEMQITIAKSFNNVKDDYKKCNYGFDWKIVKEFAEFCENCGGFVIG